MKDEVKEILDNISDNIEYYYVGSNGCLYQDLTREQLLLIKDYILNLQEENERLKKENIKLYKKDTKIINDLKEELEITQEKWNKDKQWSECRTKEWLDYKSRCEKAIEYIEDNTYKSYETDYMDLTGIKELLNILNGGDE